MKKIFYGGTVITMGPKGIIDPGMVVIEGSRIVSVEPGGNNNVQEPGVEYVDCTGMIVMPGLIDAHFHTCQQGLRGVFAQIRRMRLPRAPGWKWFLIPWESRLSAEQVYVSALAAYTNMLRVGTTCFSEHGGRHSEMMVRAMEEVGVRGLVAISTMDMDTGEPKLPENMHFTTQEAIQRNLELVKRWPFNGEGLARGVFSLRQIIVCTPELIRTIVGLAEEYETMVQTHANEGHYEIEYALEKHGLRPVEYLDKIGGLSDKIIAAHSVLMSEREVELFAEHGVGVAHCPSGNYQMLGMADLRLMQRLHVPIGIGSDGAAGGSISLFREMWVSLVGQNMVFGSPKDDRPVQSMDVLEMATIGGAKVLGLEDEIGSLEVGKRADLILLDKTDLDVMPSQDAAFSVVNCCSGNAPVVYVMVNGRTVMKDGEIVSVDEDRVKTLAGEALIGAQETFLESLKRIERS